MESERYVGPYGSCDHDICICGETYEHVDGGLVTAVPHSGLMEDWRPPKD